MKNTLLAAAVLSSFAAFAFGRPEVKEVTEGGVLGLGAKTLGYTLFEGRVLATADTVTESKRDLRNHVLSDGIKVESQTTEHAALVKFTFAQSLELRGVVDFSWGYPKDTSVRVCFESDDAIQGYVDAPEGREYFYLEFNKDPSRWGMFKEGEWTTFARDLEGRNGVGFFFENFYGIEGDDFQYKLAFSKVSTEDARTTLRKEIPGYFPSSRTFVDQGLRPGQEKFLPPEIAATPDLERELGIANPTAYHIQRFMKKITESTAENPATVKILFYGQSIVWQHWTRDLIRSLQRRYPTVRFLYRNNAIGGYESGVLRVAFDQDAIQYYPDLVFFHDYGSLIHYGEMIGKFRKYTAAEIILYSSHVRGSFIGSDPRELMQQRGEMHGRACGIQDVAAKYHCMYIDLERKWCQLLFRNRWNPNELLADGIHLNALGRRWYRYFIEEELVRIPECCGDEEATGSERFIPFDAKKMVKKDGSIELDFTGNRVVAVADGEAEPALAAEVLLDGRPMADRVEFWGMTRPSVWHHWMPGLLSPAFVKPPVEQQWTVTFLPPVQTNAVEHLNLGLDGKPRRMVPQPFRVEGAVTGDEGAGVSNEKFVSKSGFAVDAHCFYDWINFSKPQCYPQPGTVQKSYFRSYPLFAARLTAKPAGEETLLAQGREAGRHKLTIKTAPDAKAGIRGFRVWNPAPAERKSSPWSQL